jgi:protein required for attachment to host cells
MRHPKTLVVLASEHETRMLVNEGPGRGLVQIERFEPAEDPARYTDRPDRVQESASSARSAIEPRTSLRAQHREAAARQIVERLARMEEEGRFDRLVIAAAPPLLGVLRDALPGRLARLIHADLDKDLIHVPADALPPHLVGILRL